MLEAFLEESFLCSEMILAGCLTCLLKMWSPLCGVCLLEAGGVADELVCFFLLW